jgi:hypothetical protein
MHGSPPGWCAPHLTLIGSHTVLGLSPAHEIASRAQTTPTWTLLIPAANSLHAHAGFVPLQLRGQCSAAYRLTVLRPGRLPNGRQPIAAALLATGDPTTWSWSPQLCLCDWKALGVEQEDLATGRADRCAARGPARRDRWAPHSNGLRAATLLSRGSPLAHRFALVHPERVSEVAVFSAGIHTLPERLHRDDLLAFGTTNFSSVHRPPFRPDSLRQVHFLVGQGLLDASSVHLPRVGFVPGFYSCAARRGIRSRGRDRRPLGVIGGPTPPAA